MTNKLVDARKLPIYRNGAGHYSPLTAWLGLRAGTRKYIREAHTLIK